MPQERLTLRKISEILRLKHEAGLSNRAIATIIQMCHPFFFAILSYGTGPLLARSSTFLVSVRIAWPEIGIKG